MAIDGDDFEDHWATTMAINLTAYARFVRAALPDLRRERSAMIIDVASTEGVGATAGSSPYPATKHGMIGLTRSLAVELDPAGVTVNYVCPGPINTGMTEFIRDGGLTIRNANNFGWGTRPRVLVVEIAVVAQECEWPPLSALSERGSAQTQSAHISLSPTLRASR